MNKIVIDVEVFAHALKEIAKVADKVIHIKARGKNVMLVGASSEAQAGVRLESELEVANISKDKENNDVKTGLEIFIDKDSFCSFVFGLAGFCKGKLNIEVLNENIKVSCGKIENSFQKLIETSFTPLSVPDKVDEPLFFLVDGMMLSESIQKTRVLAGASVYPFTEYINFTVEGERLNVIAVANHGFAEYIGNVTSAPSIEKLDKETDEDHAVRLEAKKSSETSLKLDFNIHYKLASILDFKDTVMVTVGKTTVAFRDHGKMIIINLSNVQFPKNFNFFETKFKEEGMNSFTFDKNEFRGIMNVLSTIKEVPSVIQMNEEAVLINKDKAKIALETLEYGTFSGIKKVNVYDQHLRVVDKFSSKKITLTNKDTTSPIFFTSPEDLSFRVFIMPCTNTEEDKE